MRHVFLVAVAAILATSALQAAPHQSLTGAKLMPLAKVPLSAATTFALKVRPGTVVNQELEKEKGGSGLRYSFDIKSGEKVYEVGIDARTGRVLENSLEGPHLD